MRVFARKFLRDERGAGMAEYALLLFAVLLAGAAGAKKLGPKVISGGDVTRRILSGEDVNVPASIGGAVGGISGATSGSLNPSGDSAGSGGTAGGGDSTGSPGIGGAGSSGSGGSSGGGGSAVGGSGSGSSGSAGETGGGVLLGASGSSEVGGGGGGGDLGGGLGSFSTESAGGGGSSSGGGSSGGGGGSFGSGGSFGGGSSTTGGSSSGSGSSWASAGSFLGSLLGNGGTTDARSGGARSSTASTGSSSTPSGAGKNTAKDLQSVMPVGLLGASRANEVNPPPSEAGGVSGNGYTISAAGERQMQALLARARRNVGARRPKGRCYHMVKIDIQEVGYGNIPRQTANAQLRPLPGSDQGYAHQFADYMNARAANGHTNADNLGLQRLPITNPYNAPPGSIIVVRAGTPGTHNPVAGDIVVAGGNGHFYNDGNMGYRGSQNFRPGNNYVLGIYAPK